MSGEKITVVAKVPDCLRGRLQTLLKFGGAAVKRLVDDHRTHTAAIDSRKAAPANASRIFIRLNAMTFP